MLLDLMILDVVRTCEYYVNNLGFERLSDLTNNFSLETSTARGDLAQTYM